MAGSLSIGVFNSGYKSIPGGSGWDDRTPATWPASTSTLISGDRDALLVDALLTTSEGQRPAAWVQNTGKRPRAIFVTHGHGDHFFGAGPVLDAFPGAPLIACDQQVVDQARAQTTPKAMANRNSRFAGQFSQSPAVPALADSPEFDLDGHPLLFRAIGGADGVLATIVHVPEIRAVCSGDIAYNNIHMWLWNSTPDSREAWLASLDAVAALNPSTIITGHKDPGAPDDNATHVLDQSRRYLEDFGPAHKSADPHGRRFPVNTTDQRPEQSGVRPTIVLVHGAFADASSWNGVTERLQQQGYTVIAPANPLRGVAADSAYIASLLGQIDGPVLLAGHSYGGAVITNAATSAPNVVGLVFVAAFAPDEGETLGEVENGSKDSILNSALVQYQYPAGPDGESSVEFAINPPLLQEAFAADLPVGQTALMAATQRPVAAAAFSDVCGPPAWRTLPSWAVVATGDKAAGADVVRSMARRAGADIVEVEGSHVIMISQPQAVTDHILKAARAVADAHR